MTDSGERCRGRWPQRAGLSTPVRRGPPPKLDPSSVGRSPSGVSLGAGAAGESGAEVRYRGQRPRERVPVGTEIRRGSPPKPDPSSVGRPPSGVSLGEGAAGESGAEVRAEDSGHRERVPNGTATRRHRGRRALQRQVSMVTNQFHGVGWSRTHQQLVGLVYSRGSELDAEAEIFEFRLRLRRQNWPREAVLSACGTMPAQAQAVLVADDAALWHRHSFRLVTRPTYSRPSGSESRPTYSPDGPR